MRRTVGVALCCLVGGAPPALAQSTVWDSTISNTHWYVPVPQLLAYAAPATGFVNPIPIGDQTLWTLGASTNGSFTGTSAAQIAIGPTLLTDNSNIQGFVTTAGQITMVFTPVGGGTPTIGLGQMQAVNGVTSMEMQMITGGALLVTHWAYMLPYDPSTFTPPPAAPVPANSVPQWTWIAGTPWRIVSPSLFGTAVPGRFIISDFQNGYFWGRGLAPPGSPISNFTLLGSITPEGKVLFNTLSNGTLTSLYGNASGDPSVAQMLVAGYDVNGPNGTTPALITLMQPYANILAAANNRAGLGAAAALYRIAGSPLGLAGAMAPVIDVLENLDAPGLSAAVSQTLPVFAGAATQATWTTQRALTQAVVDRLDDIRDASLKDDSAVGRKFWLRPLGGVLRQDGVDGAPGYRAKGGGVAAGVDGSYAGDLRLGGVLAWSHHSLTGSNDAVANALALTSYQAGVYGAYALGRDTEINFQLDAGVNRNSENRIITFMNSAAAASYTSITTHAALGMKKIIPLQGGSSVIPSLRMDFAYLHADAYSEGGANALSLNVNSQLYRELMLTAGLKGVYRLADNVHLNADFSAGYNTLDTRTLITASYAGGGEAFVTSGIRVSPWLYSAGVSLVGRRSETLDLSLRFGVQASPTGLFGQTGSLVVRMKI